MSDRYIKSSEHSYRVNSTRPVGRRFDAIERDEIQGRIRQGILDGKSDKTIALEVGICDRTVMRYRHARDIRNVYGDDRRRAS